MNIRTFFWAGAMLLILVGGYFWYQNRHLETLLQLPAEAENTQRVIFEIRKGESVKSVAKRLEEKKLINSAWALYRYVKREDLGKEIQAGKVLLKKSYTIPEVVQYLTRALGSEMPVIIREGLTINQIDAYLAEEGILPAGEFEKCAVECSFDFAFLASRPSNQSLEGYLFPDTYFIDTDTVTASGLIRRMLQNFENRTRDLTLPANRTMHQIVTMASLIEKEERKESEKPVVSGILWKRFDIRMHLGVDATVRYALDKWTGPLYVKDLDTDSPYNTRKFIGLPPGPIGNPGLSSIRASVRPAASDYWYYLHGRDGAIRYAKTLDEHNRNKQRYL